MGSKSLFASLFVLSFASVAVTAKTPAPDSGALAHLNFTTGQKQTIYQNVAKTKKNNAAPVGFRHTVGALVPSGIELAPIQETITALFGVHGTNFHQIPVS
jgi:hypothetical protein